MHRARFLSLLILAAAVVGLIAQPESPGVHAQPPSAGGPSAGGPNSGAKGYELRLIRVGKTFQGLRFKVSTGEAWLVVVDSFEKIRENGPVPTGDYEVTLVTDDSAWLAFRIDRVSGATWQLKNRQWVKMKEPE